MGKKDKVYIEDLSEAVAASLNEYKLVFTQTFRNAVHEVAEDTASAIGNAAPGMVYPNSWTTGYQKIKGESYTERVYSEAPFYRLAHLLEHGHASRNGGRVKAYVHIAPAEAAAQEELIAKIREIVK